MSLLHIKACINSKLIQNFFANAILTIQPANHISPTVDCISPIVFQSDTNSKSSFIHLYILGQLSPRTCPTSFSLTFLPGLSGQPPLSISLCNHSVWVLRGLCSSWSVSGQKLYNHFPFLKTHLFRKAFLSWLAPLYCYYFWFSF